MFVIVMVKLFNYYYMQLLLKQFRFRISSLITSKQQCTFCSEKTKDSNV